MTDNFLITIQPVPPKLAETDGIACLAALIQAEAVGPAIALEDIITPEWAGKYTVDLIPLEVAGLEQFGWKVDELQKDGQTHIALVKPTVADMTMRRVMFGGAPVRNTAFLLWYSQTANEYRMIHCRECAVGLVNWFTEMQEKWDADFGRQGQVSEARH
jgi:hypothetical protein